MRYSRKTRYLLAALFAALTAICSQIQIPLPMIPINLAIFSVLLSGAILGTKMGFYSMLIYVLLGAMGAPVFAGLQGGIGILFGKTGGYILGYLAAAPLVGALVKRWRIKFWPLCGAMAIGVGICYMVGTIWFMLVMHLPLWMSLLNCVFPFLIGDAVKIALAAYLTQKLYKIQSK